jgi:hypothetical protein
MRLMLKTIGLSLLCAAAQAQDTHITLCDFAGAKALAWSWVGPLVSSLAKDKAPDGTTGMAIAVSAGAGTTQAYIKTSAGLEALGPGAVIEFKVWLPAGSAFSGFEPYSSDANGHWAGVWTGAFKAGQWNSFTHRVPCDAVAPLSELGLYLFASGNMQTTAYLASLTGVPGPVGSKARKTPALRTLKELP